MDQNADYHINNAPMPLEGGDLEVARYPAPATPHQYYSETTHGNNGHYYKPYQTPIPPSSPTYNSSSPQKEDKILGLKPRTLLIIITSLLLLVISSLALIGALLGTKIAKLESSSSSSPQTPTTTSPNGFPPTTTTSSAPATITTNISVPGYKYIGCYIDDNNRILRDFAPDVSNSMTNQLCALQCGKQFKYFGTESGDQCYCGMELPEDAAKRKGNEWNCIQNCAGANGRRQEICGGNWFIGVWERV
ncbi:hypothetical protein QBC38DRAFT_281814 [Podospora fimiseda]|uniref:WSC domain-containing protein n=1 Tax=Podospora fimiseda TaxID=252190 RepID=A0AAN7BK82_9PEZI|nr:hypothetical protein QBC38DRAFT_281814 [Podospora fimiseda]